MAGRSAGLQKIRAFYLPPPLKGFFSMPFDHGIGTERSRDPGENCLPIVQGLRSGAGREGRILPPDFATLRAFCVYVAEPVARRAARVCREKALIPGTFAFSGILVHDLCPRKSAFSRTDTFDQTVCGEGYDDVR